MSNSYNCQTVNKLMGGGRSLGLDLVRSLAIFDVIAGHYFINTNFKEVPLGSISIFLLGMIKTLTLTGVPLFLLLTGFLNINKTKFDIKYIKGIRKVLISYLFFCCVTILFKVFFLGQENTILGWIHEVTSFTAIPYGWYIEMWIGLYILTPFLNILWKSLSHKEQKILLFVLFVCSSLPDFTNRYGMHILPGYWVESTYPLLFFYIGSYIRRHESSFKKYKTTMMILVALLLSMFDPLLSLIIHGNKPLLGLQGGPGGIIVMPITVIMFLLLYKIQSNVRSLKYCISNISICSLDMYLAAWMFDKMLYPIVNSNFSGSFFNLHIFILIVLSLFIGNFIFIKIKNDFSRYIGLLLEQLITRSLFKKKDQLQL